MFFFGELDVSVFRVEGICIFGFVFFSLLEKRLGLRIWVG